MKKHMILSAVPANLHARHASILNFIGRRVEFRKRRAPIFAGLTGLAIPDRQPAC